jgi:hypothetical protein
MVGKKIGTMNTRPSLRTRFEAFVKTLDGYEGIDALLKYSKTTGGRMRADHLFQNRKIIVEQKVLESDPVTKPQKFAGKIMQERGIVALGRVPTQRLFSRQPDADDLQKRLALNVVRIINANVAKADKQARDTRLIFSIPDAVGILILLNESAKMLFPNLITYALKTAFQETNNGALLYTQNDGVILISEAHTLALTGVPGISRAHPIFTYTSPQTKSADIVVAFAEMLKKKWAAFNRAPMIKAN